MSRFIRCGTIALALATVAAVMGVVRPAAAHDPATLRREADAALKTLYETTPGARELVNKASAVLVFPNIVKAGFLFGAQYGDGVLLKGGRPSGEYNISAVSYGLQAGVQAFGYAMLFMNASALTYLDKTDGFEVGVGPSVVVLDQAAAKNLTTSTIQNDIYAFIFGQQGLMAGMGVQGSKITRIAP